MATSISRSIRLNWALLQAYLAAHLISILSNKLSAVMIEATNSPT